MLTLSIAEMDYGRITLSKEKTTRKKSRQRKRRRQQKRDKRVEVQAKLLRSELNEHEHCNPEFSLSFFWHE